MVAASLVLFAVGLGATSVAPTAAEEKWDSFTFSTRHITTTQRVDLPTADAARCGTPAAEPLMLSSTSIALEPVVTVEVTSGPGTVFIGEDETTPYEVQGSEKNYNTRTTYETVVTQTYQGTAAGPPCDDDSTNANGGEVVTVVTPLTSSAPVGAVSVGPKLTG